MILWPGGAP